MNKYANCKIEKITYKICDYIKIFAFMLLSKTDKFALQEIVEMIK